MEGPPTPDPRVRRHRALASPSRARLVELLQAADRPLDAAELAELTGLHLSTVRSHLAILVEADVVTARSEPTGRPGRPRQRYEVGDDADGADDGYRFLATALTGALRATTDDPGAAARASGEAWGRFLVDRPAPGRPVPAGEAVARVHAMLATAGFAPEPGAVAPEVLVRRCPFLTLAREDPEVVCNLHLGLLRGALAELGHDPAGTELTPFVAPSLCVASLPVAADGRG
jgi:predicted ArsR family transcriptional regulator